MGIEKRNIEHQMKQVTGADTVTKIVDSDDLTDKIDFHLVNGGSDVFVGNESVTSAAFLFRLDPSVPFSRETIDLRRQTESNASSIEVQKFFMKSSDGTTVVSASYLT